MAPIICVRGSESSTNPVHFRLFIVFELQGFCLDLHAQDAIVEDKGLLRQSLEGKHYFLIRFNQFDSGLKPPTSLSCLFSKSEL